MSAWVWAAGCPENPGLLTIGVISLPSLSAHARSCVPLYCYSTLSNLKVHNCLYYSKWLSGPQEWRMWGKKAFVRLSFGVLSIQWWITFVNKSGTWLCHDWQREWEETIGFLLKPFAELTFSWRASSLQHKMKMARCIGTPACPGPFKMVPLRHVVPMFSITFWTSWFASSGEVVAWSITYQQHMNSVTKWNSSVHPYQSKQPRERLLNFCEYQFFLVL